MAETAIRYFPINFDALRKGDIIPSEVIAAFCGSPRGTQCYDFTVLSLRTRIMRECRDRGMSYTLAVIKGELRILTDEEAAIYNARMCRSGFRRQYRSLKRLAQVDPTALSSEQQRDHERNLLVYGRMVQAARSARATVIAIEHQRTIPGLPAQ